MGGLVSGITGGISDVVSGVGDIAGNALSGVAANPIGAVTSLATGNYSPLIGSALGGALGGGSSGGSLASGLAPSSGGYNYGPQPIYINNAPGQTQQDQQSGLFAQLLPFLLATGGGLAQGATNKEAAQAQADALRQAGQQAATASQFKPVGTTTRFGTSSYQIDPTTGQLTSAGYTPSALTQGYQNQLAGMTNQGLLQGQQLQGLASQYLGESPEAVRQRYVEQQNALLAPGQEQTLAGIRNKLFQTGRGGLATGATTAGGLAATNPEMAAYYNSLANQQRQIAAGADQAAQQQITFGQGLAGQAYQPFTSGFAAQGAVESAAQQPMKMSTDLASQFQQANATGAKYNLLAQDAATQAMLKANQTNPLADIMAALGKTPTATTAIGGALGGALGGLFGGGTANASTASPNINLSGLGNIFNSDALNFGGWTGGGTSVYNPAAFSLGGDYGGGNTDYSWANDISGWW